MYIYILYIYICTYVCMYIYIYIYILHIKGMHTYTQAYTKGPGGNMSMKNTYILILNACLSRTCMKFLSGKIGVKNAGTCMHTCIHAYMKRRLRPEILMS